MLGGTKAFFGSPIYKSSIQDHLLFRIQIQDHLLALIGYVPRGYYLQPDKGDNTTLHEVYGEL